MNLGELTEEARDRALDEASAVTDAKAQVIAKILVDDLIMRTGGFWLYDEHTFSTTADTAEYAFPSRFMRPLALFNTTNNGEVIQSHWRAGRVDIDRSNSGVPDVYFPTYTRNVQAQPSSASTVTIVSDSTSDTSANNHYFRIRGLDSNDVEVSVTLDMDGTTPVPSTATFTELYTAEKVTSASIEDDSDNRYVSNGQYTLTSGATTLVQLGTDENRREFQWYRMLPTPDAADNYRLEFLRYPSKVSSKYDKLDIPLMMDNCALLFLDWYIKYALLDKRDDKAFNFYIEQCNTAKRFLQTSENKKIVHGEIDPTRGGGLPTVGYISRRA